MSSVNIRRDVKDAFYRYKMPRIQSKIEGKGNGIKTVVSNMTEVARALSRPPAYVTKFFGSELGSIVHCDDKTGRYIVNGAHDADKLATSLDSFISKFVLCAACDNPETDLEVAKDGMIWRACKACGHRSTVDMGHKLVAYIQKNPPPKKRNNKGVSADADGAQEEALAEGEHEEETGMDAPDNLEDGFMTEQSKLGDGWADSGSLREAELAGLSAVVRDTLHVHSGSLESFGDWLAENQKLPNEDIQTRISTLGLSSDKTVAVIVQVLLEPTVAGTSISSLFAQRLPLFKSLVSTGKDQKAFLGGLERLIGLHHPELIRNCPALLQTAFNEDLLDEEAILEWHGHISKRYMSDRAVGRQVREAAEPFIQWLQMDEDEESE